MTITAGEKKMDTHTHVLQIQHMIHDPLYPTTTPLSLQTCSCFSVHSLVSKVWDDPNHSQGAMWCHPRNDWRFGKTLKLINMNISIMLHRRPESGLALFNSKHPGNTKDIMCTSLFLKMPFDLDPKPCSENHTGNLVVVWFCATAVCKFNII